MPIIQLSGFIIVPENDLEAVLAELPNHIKLTQDEAGCLSFTVTQMVSEPSRFDVAEEFASREDFDQHQLRVKASHWGAITANVERHYEIVEL